ncbi:putative ubiquitin carboxyl-terminal hydrolase 12-like [Sesbania bispinosa]|nr:putative ubiquitin carboxyl-terminal hydrolase 12-like [Sesbania bispinosa]
MPSSSNLMSQQSVVVPPPPVTNHQPATVKRPNSHNQVPTIAQERRSNPYRTQPHAKPPSPTTLRCVWRPGDEDRSMTQFTWCDVRRCGGCKMTTVTTQSGVGVEVKTEKTRKERGRCSEA